MSETYWPFDTGAGANINEQQWRGLALALGTLGPGVLTDPAVAQNLLTPFGDSTGMHVKVDTGRATVYGHTYDNSSTVTLTIGANATGSTRVDAVIVKFDFSANTAGLAVVPGPSGGALPTLTQNFTSRYDVVLGYVNVTNGAATITAGMVAPSAGRFATPPWGGSWGLVADPVTVAVDQSSVTTDSDVTGLSITFTPIPGRWYKVIVSLHVLAVDVASPGSIRVTDSPGTTIFGRWLMNVAPADETNPTPFNFSYYEKFTTGTSVTRKVRLHPSSGETLHVSSSIVPGMLSIEDAGRSQ